MTDEQWPRVKALFQAAVERPAGERDAFLAAVAGGDDALRREVESLLTSDTSKVSFLDRLPAVSEPGRADPLTALAGLMDHTRSGPVLSAGLRVGPYEIVGPLGAGAMGEVYRARDTTLNRDVALKVLPELFARDPDRLARFMREAQLLATLNHPNIAAIYGLEQSNGGQALVLELVDGPTLADRITGGPILLAEALIIARQIAQALEGAHEKGIIHRDLKPSNIKIAADGVVKVLDFGLAKVWDGAPQSDLSASPRLTSADISEHTPMGTPAYMSPEQARCQSLDRRTDIWSFGCVLYEMLTGRAPFGGDTVPDTIAAILEREPDQTMLPADTPLPIRRLLRRCLEKDRKARLDSAAGARLEIDDAIAPPGAETLALAATRPSRVAPVAIAALAGGAVIAALVTWAVTRPAPLAPVLRLRFAIVPPSDQPLNVSGGDRDLTVSPDGRQLVYRAGGIPSFGSALMARAADQLDARELVGFWQIGALGVFASPDSRWIGVFTTGALKKTSISGGPAITLCQVSGVPLGASWGDDNSIVFATDDSRTGLWRVSADGGEPTVLTTPDAAQREGDHAFPSVLPGGRGVLFTITAGQANNAQVAVLDLTTGRSKTLVRGGSQAEYVDPSIGSGQAGYLIYAAAGTLRAVRFDPAKLEVLSDPVTVVDRVMIKPNGAANYAVSREGTLVYVPSGLGVQMTPRSVVWVDRKGHEEPIKAPLRDYCCPRVSPDGTRLALETIDADSSDIWIWNLARKQLRRLTFAPGHHGLPTWTPDGQRIVFNSDRVRSGVRNLYSQAADGTGTVERLTDSATPQFPTSITPDGTRVVANENVSGAPPSPAASGYRVLLFPLTSPASRPGPGSSPGVGVSRVEPSAQSLFDGTWAEFSPDGRYLAYEWYEAGRSSEVYVRPFPQVDAGRWQISTAGGTRPAWARNGRELFYLDLSNTLTAVPVRTSGSTFSAGTPAKVFDAKYAEPFPSRNYDVSPDGQRFLMVKDSATGDPKATPASMVVVLNWFEELKQRVSVNRK